MNQNDSKKQEMYEQINNKAIVFMNMTWYILQTSMHSVSKYVIEIQCPVHVIFEVLKVSSNLESLFSAEKKALTELYILGHLQSIKVP